VSLIASISPADTVMFYPTSTEEKVGESLVAAAIARVLIAGGDPAIPRGLAALVAGGPRTARIVNIVAFHLAAAGCAAALPWLLERLDSVDKNESEADEEDFVVLAWSVAILRPDGPVWLQDWGRRSGHEDECRFAGFLLAISRADAREPLPPDVRPKGIGGWEQIVRMLLENRSFECLRTLLAARMDLPELFTILQLLDQACLAGGRSYSPFGAAMTALWGDVADPVRDALTTPDPQYLLTWLAVDDERVRVALVRRASRLAPSLAGPLLAGVLARLSPLGKLDDFFGLEAFQLALCELGCLENFAALVGEGMAALVRLRTQQYGPAGVPPVDRALALGQLLAHPLEDGGKQLDLLRGDPAFDALVSMRLYAAGLEEADLHFRERHPSQDLFARLSPTDRLSELLCRPDAVAEMERSHAAMLLQASPFGAVRALATPLLFHARVTDADAFRPLRELQLADPAPVVRASLLTHLREDCLTLEERTTAILSLASSGTMNDRRSLAQLLGVQPEPSFIPVIFRLAFDENDDVRAAAQASLRCALQGGEDPLVCITIADAWAVAREYQLNDQVQLGRVLQDHRGEAMRLLLLALEKRTDPSAVAASLGRRLVLTPIMQWPPPPDHGAALGQNAFEQLALHLHVILVDAESGSIVAEVGEAQTGEVISAIFETGDTAMLQARWG
jgi:hypothetical protein